jgi:hypothetical protein
VEELRDLRVEGGHGWEECSRGLYDPA